MAFYQKGTSINLAKAKIISDFRDLNEKFKITVYDSTVFQTSKSEFRLSLHVGYNFSIM